MPGLPWWSKVRAHIKAGHTSYADLATRTGHPQRTLRRWIGRGPDANPRNAPSGEIHFVEAIAEALGWPLWYLIDQTADYPPPEPVLRLEAALSRIPPDRRPLVAQIFSTELADLMADLADRYGELRDELDRRTTGD